MKTYHKKTPSERFQRYSRKYQSAERVQSYDTRLFSTLKGRLFNTAERRALRKAFSHLAPDGDVLDVPCGTGRITKMLLDLEFRVTGADISEEMLGVARKKLAGRPNLLDLRREDSTRLAFEDGAFSASVSVRYLADIPPEYQQKVLSEMSRTARDVVVAVVSCDSTINRVRRKLKALLGSTMSDFPVVHKVLERWADECGLEIVAEYAPIRFLSEELVVVFRHRATGRPAPPSHPSS